MSADHKALAARARALKAEGRLDEALAVDLQAIDRFGKSGVAWHNYAATLGDLGRGADSMAACEKAFALGLDAPETWSVYARARLAAGDPEGAEAAYRESLKRAGANVLVAAELANVVWMRRGDLDAAQEVLNACFAAGGAAAPLLLTKASLLEASGDARGAADLLATAAERLPGDQPLLLAAAQAALEAGRLAQAEALVRQGEAVDPTAPGLFNQWAILHLAAGRPQAALKAALTGLEANPEDQSLWGWAATAARGAGDPLHEQLYDFEAMVGVYDLPPPAGWATLDGFLRDLSGALERLHVYQQHPASQSLRQGSQTMHLLTGSDDPAIKAFFKALDAPIREHMTRVGEGPDPLRRRNTFDYRIQGAWSVLLRPGGFHRDHFHPQGWISSAFYVETPDAALEGEDKGGWLRLGQPPYRTDPPQGPERYIRPKPGRLVLFPSYMWHGTEPFTTQERRMTIAFDVVPRG